MTVSHIDHTRIAILRLGVIITCNIKISEHCAEDVGVGVGVGEEGVGSGGDGGQAPVGISGELVSVTSSSSLSTFTLDVQVMGLF